MALDLFQTGTLLRKPGGNVENVAEHMAAGVRWEALNVGGDVGFDPSVWDNQRRIYSQLGMPYGPWMHVRGMDNLRYLLDTAIAWQSDLVGPNLEDVVSDQLSLKAVGEYIQSRWDRPVHIPTLPWLPNNQGWQHVAFAYLALEIFPIEQPFYARPEIIEQCIGHAFSEGARRVTLLYSTTSPRSAYPAAVAHCLYTADNVTNWSEWKDTVPQLPPVPPKPPDPPKPPEAPMLTPKQFPYTGPCKGPGANQTMNYSTVKGLKRAMIRLGYLNQKLGSETDDYGAELSAAMKKFQKAEHLTQNGNYARGEYAELRYAKVHDGPHKGEFALDSLALSYIHKDVLALCYPHPDVAGVFVGQGLHQTTGIFGNWAIDFMAHGGTPILAPERCRIVRFSGHNPNHPPSNGAGIWGLSTYFETTAGYQFFLTHQSARTCKVGQILDVGDQLGVVGSWPGDPSRSHSHLGCSSSKGQTDAKKHITAISQAPKLPEL